VVTISIIIVNWESKDLLRKCLRSLEQYEPSRDHEIIVVDSGSFDGCGDMLSHEFGYVRFIQSQENVGFGMANNIGVRHARGSVLVLLNPDTELLQPTIAPLVACLKQLPLAGILGCKLLNSDRSLQVTCVQPFPTISNQVFDSASMQRRFPRMPLWTSAITYDNESGPVAVEAVIGACMVMKKECFESIGGFSADYFMYAEDIDLCYETRRIGLLTYYAPHVQLIHHGGGSTKTAKTGHSRFSSVLMRQSVMRMMQRRRGLLYALGYRMAMIVVAATRLTVLLAWLPAAAARHRLPAWRTSVAKWVAILRWGLGMENWVGQRQPIARQSSAARST
jgi:GT2 family glycosyltransferase